MFLVCEEEMWPPHTRSFMALIIWCFQVSCGTLEGGEGKGAGLRVGRRGERAGLGEGGREGDAHDPPAVLGLGRGAGGE